MIWEIYGAEAYLGSTPDNEVYYTSNEIWSSMQEHEVEDVDQKHDTSPSFIKVTQWKMKPNLQTENKSLIAPKLIDKQKYKVTYSGSKNIDFANSSKVVEAFVHNNFTRATIIFKGICSFTFVLEKMKPMDQMGRWKGKYKGEDVTCDLMFSE